MKTERGVIFDLDGTLYNLRGADGTFGGSDLYADLKPRMYSYLADRLDLSSEEAEAEFERIKDKFNGEVSVGVEQEFGIDRYEWFGNTWNLDPAIYIEEPKDALAEALLPFKDRSVLLTAAAAAWAYPVLDYLGVREVFGGNVLTGEPDLRKPNPAIFCRAADLLQRQCCEVVSIGDQNESDIIPAKGLGMLTVKVGLEAGDADYFASDIYDAVDLVTKL